MHGVGPPTGTAYPTAIAQHTGAVHSRANSLAIELIPNGSRCICPAAYGLLHTDIHPATRLEYIRTCRGGVWLRRELPEALALPSRAEGTSFREEPPLRLLSGGRLWEASSMLAVFWTDNTQLMQMLNVRSQYV